VELRRVLIYEYDELHRQKVETAFAQHGVEVHLARSMEQLYKMALSVNPTAIICDHHVTSAQSDDKMVLRVFLTLKKHAHTKEVPFFVFGKSIPVKLAEIYRNQGVRGVLLKHMAFSDLVCKVFPDAKQSSLTTSEEDKTQTNFLTTQQWVGPVGETVAELKVFLHPQQLQWNMLKEFVLNEVRLDWDFLLLDFSALEYISSEGIGAMIVCLHEARKKGVEFAVISCDRKFVELLDDTSLSKVVSVFKDKEDFRQKILLSTPAATDNLDDLLNSIPE
jgi:anti-anti-sigma factor